MSNTSVISVSLTEKNLQDLDKFQRLLGLAGRSEAIRVCLRSAESEIREREGMKGDVEGILIAVHNVEDGQGLDRVGHKFQKNITTQIHSHLRSGKCLDVFLVGGDSMTVGDIIASLQKDENLEYIKFVHS